MKSLITVFHLEIDNHDENVLNLVNNELSLIS